MRVPVLVCVAAGVASLTVIAWRPEDSLTPAPPAPPVVPEVVLPPPPPEEPPPPPPKKYIYGPVVYVVPMKVTACSPQDPKDAEYYAKNGYAGDAYGIAADLQRYPKGTQMRVPGYMKTTWEEVDSSGGTVIRKDARRKGIEQIDVKFRTLKSVKTWGAQDLNVEIILPAKASAAQRHRIESLATDSYASWVREVP